MLCPSCGRENPEGFRFCGFCSAPLEPQPGAGEVRKTVTVLFCDVTGSTSMGERLDPETVRRVMTRYFGEMRSVLEAHGGTVEKFIGDAVMAVFGVPVVHEDDALRAVRAALEMRERLRRLNDELERDHGVSIVARTGVNTGEVVAGAGEETLATGDAVNVAARLEQAAAPGEILIGADTHRLVRDAVEAEPVEPLEVKGKAEPVPALRLLSVGGTEGVARRFDVPMVGRADELRTLEDALRRAERERACVLVTVLGPAGVGKSRLVREFVQRGHEGARIVRGRCLPYGEGITYWPIVELLTEEAHVGEGDGPDEIRHKIRDLLPATDDATMVAERLVQLLGVAGAMAAPAETHWAVRKLLESMAMSSPLAVVLDDIHWAEPALLDLIEHVASSSDGVPMLLLCPARPELLERRPAWGDAAPSASKIVLGPLSDRECDELLGNLLDRTDLPDPARRTIVDAADGNPLFVEQIIAMLIDERLLRRAGEGSWVISGDLTTFAMPPSTMALLEARLERLPSQERVLIERAAIEGRRFHVGFLRAVDPTMSPLDLRSLEARDLIERDRSAFGDAFRFRHILVRDAAYRRVPKRTRADLHERYVDWLSGHIGELAPGFEEIIGFHLEQAFHLRDELGPLDEAAIATGQQAAYHLLASGRRAADRGDAGASSNLLSRAVDLLPSDDPDRARALVDLSIQLTYAGDMERAAQTVDDAAATVGPDAGPSLQIAIASARLRLDAQVHPEGAAVRMRREAERSIPALEAIGDDGGLAAVWFLIGEAELFGASNAGMLDAFGRALHHAGRAGESTLAGQAAVWCMLATISGMTPVAEGLQRLDDVAAQAPSSLDVAAWSDITRGRCLAMLGDVERARSLARSGRATFKELGQALTYGSSTMETSPIDEMAGDIAAAERGLRSGYEQLVALGDVGYLSTATGRLARCVALLGRLDEAEALARVCEETSASDDVYSQTIWRQARALVLAHGGRADRALGLAQDAVRLAERTDDCLVRATALEDLAEVHRLAGRRDDAAEALRRAIAVWDRKGATFVAERLRAKRAELTAP